MKSTFFRASTLVAALATLSIANLGAETPAKTAPAAAEEPGHEFPAGSPKFLTTYKAALEASKKEGKPALLVFSAVWCGPCQGMKKDVYPSAEVKPYHDKFVWAYLDYELEENQKLGEQYKLEGIPHIQFLGTDGKELGQQLGGTSPAEFATLLKDILAKAGAKPAAAPAASAGE